VTVVPFRATVAELGNGLGLVSVSGELDLYAEPELRASLGSADGHRTETVVVDLSGVSFLDSTICGVLVSEAKRRRSNGGDLVIVTNGSRATSVLGVAGIDGVITLFPTLHDALQALLVGSPR
jgi:anti-sigma B factor antagonist